MATKSEIANKSLTLVGANPIVNLTDDTPEARIVNRVYELSLRSILSECKWNFATKRVLLTLSADVLKWYDTGETYVYIKPNDQIRIFELSSRTATWREEGKYIISDTSGLGVRYVYYLDSPSQYTAQFINAFNDKLCSDIAYMIVNSKTLGDKYKVIYEDISLPKATSANSQAGTQQVPQDTAWLDAKHNDGQPDS